MFSLNTMLQYSAHSMYPLATQHFPSFEYVLLVVRLIYNKTMYHSDTDIVESRLSQDQKENERQTARRLEESGLEPSILQELEDLIVVVANIEGKVDAVPGAG